MIGILKRLERSENGGSLYKQRNWKKKITIKRSIKPKNGQTKGINETMKKLQ